MSFLSREFPILFGMLLLVLLAVRQPTARKIIVLIVSAIFYGWAGWRFVFLLAAVTLVDYFVAHRLASEARDPRRRRLLGLSVTLNLGFLFFFKYSYFAASSMDSLLGQSAPTWRIALPIGISFYTFETLSYVIDVYRRKTKPAECLLDYAVFVSFFPRLVAGPIMRAEQFLPQLAGGFRTTPEGFASGAQTFAIGVFKKLVIADNLAFFVDRVYRNPGTFTPGTVWAAAATYCVQIYCDFSAYTDMATGLARILGIELPRNFNLPLISQSVTEFWQRWHISLSTWLRDYVYIPLGGSRDGELHTYRNLMITMVLIGLWHGASWHYVVMGVVFGVELAIERLVWRGKEIKPAPWNRPVAWLRTLVFFAVISATLVLFRAPDMQIAGMVLRKMAFLDTSGIIWIFWSAPLFVIPFWVGGFLVQRFPVRAWPFRWSNPLLPAFFVFVALGVLLFMPLDVSPFIYFRF